MTNPDPATIAKSLTKAQKEAVMSGTGSRWDCCDVLAFEPSLCSSVIFDPPQFGQLGGFTPLGLAVRAILMETSE